MGARFAVECCVVFTGDRLMRSTGDGLATRAPALDRRLAALAGRQRGVVTYRQMVDAGLSRRAIEHRLAVGRLHRLIRGAYLVGHEVPPALAIETAWLLTCGPLAVLSHLTAAVIWEICRFENGITHVSVTRPGPRERPGLMVHRVSALDATDLRRVEGLALTSPARTLVDLASVLPAGPLADALERARVRRLVTTADVLAALDRAPGKSGAPTLRRLLDEQPTMTRSKAERALLDLVTRGGLPRPQTNVRVAGHEVDTLWRSERLIVEVDGYAFHSHREAFERDRRRDAELQAAGYRVLRVTWRRIASEPESLLVTLAQALARG